MIIGIDLDNTLIDYSALFQSTALSLGLISPSFHGDKAQIKEQVLRHHGNDGWTALQGHVYGPALRHAPPYPGADDFLRRCFRSAITTCIISHKTHWTVKGPRHDLRAAALSWLEAQGWTGRGDSPIRECDIEFHLDRPSKIRAITERRCTHFIDDLPEVLLDPLFPRAAKAMLFDPEGHHPNWEGPRARDWDQLSSTLLGGGVAVA